MTRKLTSIKDVVDWGLCTGCGACFFNCDKGQVELINVESVGIRPRFADCASCTACLAICPGHRVEAATTDSELGPALEIWEGYAADPEIRFRASSGGVLTALALYCIEREDMASVLHTGMDQSRPWTNKTVQSHNRSELLARSGSRYAPSSPCEGLQDVEESPKPCVFIGKPCDASAAAMLSAARPQLDRKIGLSLTFFCAGTPSTRGTLDLMESLGVNPEHAAAVRYRGEGWPGRFAVSPSNGAGDKSLSYMDSWGLLAAYRPMRCHLCPDGLGQSADISCGDAWERFTGKPDPGRSIVIVRTERGREILRRALAEKYIELERVGPEAVTAAQPNLLQRRRELFGRLFAMKLLLIPAPSFPGFSFPKLGTPAALEAVPDHCGNAETVSAAGALAEADGLMSKLSPDRIASLYVFHPLRRLLGLKSGGIPILMYHSISEHVEARRNAYFRTFTHPRLFREQIEALAGSGYKTIGLGDAIRKLDGEILPPEKPVVLTFDDGFQDFHREAFPILNTFHYTATVFLPTAYIGDSAREFKNIPCLTWRQVQELHAEGIEFGSHTVTHPQLASLPITEVRREIRDSKEEIENRIGTGVCSFSYPYAFPETDRAFKRTLSELLVEFGYRNGVSTAIGTARVSDSRFFLRRLPVNSSDEFRLFGAKLKGSYDWLHSIQYAHKLYKGLAGR